MDFIAVLISFLFPIGIWLGLEGYELAAMISLILGWLPISAIVGRYLGEHTKVE